jgi:hypothetical protein
VVERGEKSEERKGKAKLQGEGTRDGIRTRNYDLLMYSEGPDDGNEVGIFWDGTDPIRAEMVACVIHVYGKS